MSDAYSAIENELNTFWCAYQRNQRIDMSLDTIFLRTDTKKETEILMKMGYWHILLKYIFLLICNDIWII